MESTPPSAASADIAVPPPKQTWTSNAPITTTFLIPNLHCPSCVSTISNALNELYPPPTTISHSIINHSVVVRHDAALSLQSMVQALSEASYEVYDVVQDPETQDLEAMKAQVAEFGESWDMTADKSQVQTVADSWWAFALWGAGKTQGKEAEQLRKRKRHSDNCELCRKQEEGDEAEEQGKQRARRESSFHEKDEPMDTKKNLGESVEKRSATPDGSLIVVETAAMSKSYEATVAIEGMTCSACVTNVSRALQKPSWIVSADVNLLTNSAIVRFIGDETEREKDIISLVDDAGYDATITDVRNLGGDDSQTGAASTWRAAFAIGGMTCTSCVASVTNAFQEHEWVMKVDVNLLGNSAVVEFRGREHLSDIGETIEDVGFTANLDEVTALGKQLPQGTSRRVMLRIDGMYCEHCPARIESALKNRFGRQVQIETSANLNTPIITLSYDPKPPELTIRSIVTAIDEADRNFKVKVYHPPSMEERSRRMHVREQRRILCRVIFSMIAAIPTFIIGIVYMDLVPSTDTGRQYLMQPLQGVSRAVWALLILATPVYFLAADIFHRRTLKEIYSLWRPGSPTPLYKRLVRFGSMSMLVSLGTTVAYFSSIVELILAATAPSSMHSFNSSYYFDSVIFLTMFLLLGRFIEAYSKAKTGDAIAMLGQLRPTEALLQADRDSTDASSSVDRISLDMLESGDVVRVLHGSSPPCDGAIVQGSTKFDESSLTGEAKLVSKSEGNEVFSGTINQGSAISVRVTGVAGNSMLDQIMRVVREGQTRRAPVERVADVITGHFVPIVTLLAILTWIVWLSLGLSGMLPVSYRDTNIGGWPFWSLQFAIAVFVIACPCGIGLAAPTALFVGGGLAAKHGILVKGGGEAFQEASGLDCVVFDKTGTLTQGGQPVVTDHELYLGDIALDRATLLAIVKRLEDDSSHPVARAVSSFASESAEAAVSVTETLELAGRGLKGSVDINGKAYEAFVGNETMAAEQKVAIPKKTLSTLNKWKSEAKSIVILAIKSASSDWHIAGIFAISDPIRPEAINVIRALQNRGIDTWMLTGDNVETARAVGLQLSIHSTNIIAGVLPENKATQIKDLQRSLPSRSGKRAIIAMVGDGVNDAPALATADVGIAVGSGTDVAMSAAKFVLVSSRLSALLTLVDLSRVVFRRVKFNFAWAGVYNLIGLPIAAGVLYPLKTANGEHIRLDPVWAALAMALSSVSVVCSSLLLRSQAPIVGFRPAKVKDNT